MMFVCIFDEKMVKGNDFKLAKEWFKKSLGSIKGNHKKEHHNLTAENGKSMEIFCKNMRVSVCVFFNTVKEEFICNMMKGKIFLYPAWVIVAMSVCLKGI